MYRFVPLEELRHFPYIRNLPCNLSVITKRRHKFNLEVDPKKLKALRFPAVLELLQQNYLDSSLTVYDLEECELFHISPQYYL